MKQVSKSVISVVLGFVVLALTSAAHAQQFVSKLHAPESTLWKWAGASLAIDGNTFVTGAPESIRNANAAECNRIGYGAIAVYKKSGTSWTYSQKFWHDTTPNTNEVKFGNSLSLRGNVLVASAEREDYGSVFQAGAFLVFTRANANSNFSKLGTYYAPTPTAMQRVGEGSAVATNGVYIAVGDNPAGKVYVYRLQNGAVSYLYSITVTFRPSSLFITDSNVLVGAARNSTSMTAHLLSGAVATALDTSSLLRTNTVVEGPMAGDGNTVAVMLRDDTSGTYSTQVANFANGSVSWVDTRPVATGLSSPVSGPWPARISLEEGQGYFLSLGSPTPVVLSYKFTYNGGSGHDYNYAGLFQPGIYSQVGTLTNRATPLAFNGVDLLVGDPDMDNGGSLCASTGGVDVFSVGSVASSGPSSSTKLSPWINSSGQNNGEVTAVYSGYALVGQSLYGNEQGLTGQMTLYRQVGTTWEQLEKYLDGNAAVGGAAPNSAFGAAAALNWHSLLIGAPSGGSTGTGVVYLASAVNGAYEHGPLTRTLPAPSSLHSGDGFGGSLALENETAIVGASQGGPAGTHYGAAYIYTYNYATQTWSLTQALQPPAADQQAWLSYGAKVGISGDYVVVGAPLYDGNGLSEAGVVYVYKRTNGTWSLLQRLQAPSPTNYDDFGQTLAIANGGNWIAASGWNSGVRLFRSNGSSFVTDGSVSVGSLQYAPVALSSVGLLVAIPSSSQVRRYTRVSNNNWSLGGTLTGPSGQSFGSSISLTDSNVLIGAPLSAVGPLVNGAGYATSFSNVR
ncbi:MAG TPA: hypothetical protein VHM70_03010 [Polyangiaceae bacterium]|jgi:hypothetical protein|nr:hypothetical protein [Polyangiaceae bacterium]